MCLLQFVIQMVVRQVFVPGELDDNLLPVGKEVFRYEDEDNEWEDEVEEGQARPGTTKRKQYYIKKVTTNGLK